MQSGIPGKPHTKTLSELKPPSNITTVSLDKNMMKIKQRGSSNSNNTVINEYKMRWRSKKLGLDNISNSF